MYITMDVVFHENSMYFSSESKLQGEYHKEIQTLDYDYHISEEYEFGQSELVNQEADELDMSGQQFGSEDVFIEIPNQSSSVEGVLNLEPDPFMKRLPHRHNRGIPKPTYEPELSTKVKYLMSNYVSNHRLSESNKSFVNQLSTVAIPNSVQEALADPRMHGVIKEMSEGVQIEEVIVWVEVIPERHGLEGSQITGNDSEERKALQNYLSREFEMKDLGHLKYFLGIEVSRSSEGNFLSQRKYALDLSQETGMSGCQPVNTPIEEGLKLCVDPNQVSTDRERYQRLVGKLMYLAHTRPNLAYALSVVSQYMHNLGEQHMKAVMRILRYLKNAPRKGILFAKNVDHQSIEVYTDADWVGAVDDRRSTSGYFTFVSGKSCDMEK
ncbi:Retrovirus-related Pol polyprotein from transposon RE1 [Vitis vinifera]|uniref:Retrovirus-related Pol polyprotein from transposon RE1 n=1 Tax=Vitis vinifera TaxID=29760 RepID=A0A438EZW5_VITVI|nr:Retrovirus-related Pol polyprotein from transposon RE1 [Vitis vinifera]